MFRSTTFRLNPPSFMPAVISSVNHQVIISGRPIYAKVRRSALDKLKIARAELNYISELGISRASYNPRAFHCTCSPNRRPCGDYRVLSSAVSYRYPISHIQNIKASMKGNRVFSETSPDPYSRDNNI